jgi:ssDNA-binding Zn-finger/Zn-ribbon topoisomerase 1
MFSNSGIINPPQWYQIRVRPVVRRNLQPRPRQQDIDEYNRIIQETRNIQPVNPDEKCPICHQNFNEDPIAELDEIDATAAADERAKCVQNCADIVQVCANMEPRHLAHRTCILNWCEHELSDARGTIKKCWCGRPLIPFLPGSINRSCDYFKTAFAAPLLPRDEELPRQGGRRLRKKRRTKKYNQHKKSKKKTQRKIKRI